MRLRGLLWLTGLQSYVLQEQEKYSEYMADFQLDSYIYDDSTSIAVDIYMDHNPANDDYYDTTEIAEIEKPFETTTSDKPPVISETSAVQEPGPECMTTLCKEKPDVAIIKVIKELFDATDMPQTTFEQIADEKNFTTAFGIEIPTHPDAANAGQIALIIFCVVAGLALIASAVYIRRNWNTTMIPIRIRFGLVI